MPEPYFKKVTQTGEVSISFTKQVVLLKNFVYLETAMMAVDDVLTPCFQVQALTFEGEEITMEWSVISFDEGNLKL